MDDRALVRFHADHHWCSVAVGLVATLVISACCPDRPTGGNAALDQDVYVWQRVWSADTEQRFALRPSLHHAALAGRLVWPVFRVDDHRSATSVDAIGEAISQAIQ
jgi:hypothetical protein